MKDAPELFPMAPNDDLTVLLVDICERIGKVEQSVGGINNQVTELVHTIRGFNGNTGLVTEIAILKGVLDNSKERTKESHITFSWIVDRLVAPVTTAILLYFLLGGGK